MKKCSKCNLEKDSSLFCKSERYKDKLHIYCKECIANTNEIYRLNNKEKESIRKKEYKSGVRRRKVKDTTLFHYVYLLPNENYIGTTKDISHRMSDHRSKYKRNTDNYRILAKFLIREDALELEELLHDLGYEGRHKNNMYR